MDYELTHSALWVGCPWWPCPAPRLIKAPPPPCLHTKHARRPRMRHVTPQRSSLAIVPGDFASCPAPYSSPSAWHLFHGLRWNCPAKTLRMEDRYKAGAIEPGKLRNQRRETQCSTRRRGITTFNNGHTKRQPQPFGLNSPGFTLSSPSPELIKSTGFRVAALPAICSVMNCRAFWRVA